MEAATLSENEPAEQVQAVAEVPASKLFEWSGYVHVGEGAQTCEADPCEDPKHFHAWVCLANAFQTRDIGDKARAAKARKITALRDAGGEGREPSDSYVVLEAILAERAEDIGDVIAEIVRNSVATQLPVIFKELKEEEEFENAAQDSEELRRQADLPEEDRDDEEFEQLQRSQEAFGKELENRVKRREDSERSNLEGMPQEQVIELLRKKVINEEATQAYLNTHYTWLMYVGTRDPHNHNARKFAQINELKNAAPEIVSALRSKINELENKIEDDGGGSGNS